MTRIQPNKPRVSHFINRKPASNLHHAIRVADTLGLPLNQFVTFNLFHTTCPPEAVSSAFQKLRDNYFGKWIGRAGAKIGLTSPPTFVWTIENSAGHLNVHWLVHVPPQLVPEFVARVPRWLAAVAGEVTCTSAHHIRKAPTPKGAGRYMMKGIDPAYANFYGIRHEAQGVVHGKRCGHSQNLGPVARQKAGYTPRRRFVPFPGAAAKAAASVQAPAR